MARVAKTRVANHMAMKSVKRDDMTAKESTNVSSIATFKSNCHFLHCPKTLYEYFKWNEFILLWTMLRFDDFLHSNFSSKKTSNDNDVHNLTIFYAF